MAQGLVGVDDAVDVTSNPKRQIEAIHIQGKILHLVEPLSMDVVEAASHIR